MGRRTLVVDLAVAIDIRLANHLIDFRLGELLTWKKVAENVVNTLHTQLLALHTHRGWS